MEMTVSLQAERIELKSLTSDLSPFIVQYLSHNKDFLSEFDAKRPVEYFTEAFWRDKATQLKHQSFNEAGCQLFILTKDHHKVIGYVNAANIVRGAFQACHLGYMLADKEQGKGYMTEALQLFIEYLFKQQNLHRIQANYLVDNHRSAKVLEKLGFIKEGTAKDYLLINGKWRDHILTSLVNPDWQS